VDKSGLNAQEIAALRDAMGKPAPERSAAADERDARPVPLIADDRAAVRARPAALRIGIRWASRARHTLLRLTGDQVQVAVLGAETVDGASLRDVLAGSWLGLVAVTGRPDTALVSAGGAMVEALAARLLGAAREAAAKDRPPSPATLRVFAHAGESLVGALVDVWQEEQGCELRALGSELADRWCRDLHEGEVVIALTLEIKGSGGGLLRLVARPETLVARRLPVDAVPAPPGAVDAALGQVPVEVSVELGRVRLTLSELGALRPGQLLILNKFVDDLLPVRCAGKIKAWGRALVVRGAMAVEIADATKEDDDERR
jgi:flagellar motor switch protein FliM